MSRRGRSRPAVDGPPVDLTTTVGSLELANPVMTASGTAGHGDELAAYVDLVLARRGRREVALRRPVGRQPGAPGARDPGGHDQQRRAPGPGRAGLARRRAARRCWPPGPGWSSASGARTVEDYAPGRRDARRRARRGDRRRGQRVVPQPPRPGPHVRPVARADRRRGGRGLGVRPAHVGEAQPERPVARPRSPRPPPAPGPRPSRWSTRCWAWPSTPRPAGPGWAAGAAACRARRSTRSPCGRSTTCTATCPTCPIVGVGGVANGRRRRRAHAGRRLRGAGGHGELRRPPQRRAGARRDRGVVPGPRCGRGSRADRRRPCLTQRPTPPAPRRSCGPAWPWPSTSTTSSQAQRLAGELRPWFGVAKVGLELYSAAGPEVIEVLVEDGFEVFVDLKLLDIPTTVSKAARVIGSLGASYLTVHTRAGVDHLKAGVDGFNEGATAAGLVLPDLPRASPCSPASPPTPPPWPSGSASPRPPTAAASCARRATSPRSARLAPDLLTVVPGIRPAGVGADDQARPATPVGRHRRRRPRARHRPGRHPRRRSGRGRRRHRRRGRRRPLTGLARRPDPEAGSDRAVPQRRGQAGVAGPSASRGMSASRSARSSATWAKASRRRISRVGRPERRRGVGHEHVVVAAPGQAAQTAGVQGDHRTGAGADDEAHRRPGEPGDQGEGDAEDAELVLVLHHRLGHPDVGRDGVADHRHRGDQRGRQQRAPADLAEQQVPGREPPPADRDREREDDEEAEAEAVAEGPAERRR